MIDIIIILLLLIGLAVGARRGLILQVVHLVGLIAAYVVAFIYYDDLADKIKLWIPYPSGADQNAVFSQLRHLDLEAAYYNAIAFLIIFLAVKIILQIIGSMLDFLAHLPILNTLNRWLGALFGFIEVYLIIFVLLYIIALTPYLGLDARVADSGVAQFMLNHTPIVSGKIHSLWTTFTHAKILTSSL